VHGHNLHHAQSHSPLRYDISADLMSTTMSRVADPFAFFAKGWRGSYPSFMAIDWLEVAKKMAEDARAQLAINRKRLREIVAERARQQATQEPHPNAR
jgi:hypothetical protein